MSEPRSAARSAPDECNAIPAHGTPAPGVPVPRLGSEVLLVLGVSLGASALQSLLTLAARLTADTPLSHQATVIHSSLSASPWLDVTGQLIDIGLGVMPALLALYLLADVWGAACRRIGFDLTRPGRDVRQGLLWAAAIGVPGLALYIVGRLTGLTVRVIPADLGNHWWTVPILLAAAAEAAIQEEVVVTGYLLTRLEELRWPAWAAWTVTAVLRGCYHTYQGVGPMIGNAAMGLLFAVGFTRTRRVGPLVVAHFILDVCSFVGFALAGPWLHAIAPAVF